MNTKGILLIGLACLGAATTEAVPTFETYFVQDNQWLRLQVIPNDIPAEATAIRYYFWHDWTAGPDSTTAPDGSFNYGGVVGFVNFDRPGLHDVTVGVVFGDGSETIYDAPDYTVDAINWQLPLGSVPPEKGASVPDAGSSAAMLVMGLGAVIGLSHRR